MIRLLLDPGHGGNDDGATVVGDVREDVLALDIAKEAALSLHGLPIECELTRYGDDFVSLYDRAVIAKRFEADLVIGIHLNAGVETLHGADVFTMDGDRDAAQVGDIIARAMPPKVYTNRRHVAAPLPHWTGRAYNCLDPHRRLHGKPCVLVECCFLTAKGDREFVTKLWSRSSIVTAIRAGVCKFGEMRGAA